MARKCPQYASRVAFCRVPARRPVPNRRCGDLASCRGCATMRSSVDALRAKPPQPVPARCRPNSQGVRGIAHYPEMPLRCTRRILPMLALPRDGRARRLRIRRERPQRAAHRARAAARDGRGAHRHRRQRASRLRAACRRRHGRGRRHQHRAQRIGDRLQDESARAVPPQGRTDGIDGLAHAAARRSIACASMQVRARRRISPRSR